MKLILLSTLVAQNPAIDDFWSLERCVSAAARSENTGDIENSSLTFDVEPEYRSTPKKWKMILTAAYERGVRAKESAYL